MYPYNAGLTGDYISQLEGLGGMQRYAAAGYGVGQALPPPAMPHPGLAMPMHPAAMPAAPGPMPVHPAAVSPPMVAVPPHPPVVVPPGHPAHPHHPRNGHHGPLPHHPYWGQGVFLPGPAPIYGPPPFFAAPPGGGIAYGGAPAVVERPLRDMREFPLGFFQSGISAIMGAIDVISRPQIVFRGERLVVPSSIAADFALIDIKVGNRSQLANSTALPAQVFSEVAVGVRLALDTAVVAQDIALIVENVSVSGSAETFIAALIGTAAQ